MRKQVDISSKKELALSQKFRIFILLYRKFSLGEETKPPKK